jgi:hypothetical protein
LHFQKNFTFGPNVSQKGLNNNTQKISKLANKRR